MTDMREKLHTLIGDCFVDDRGSTSELTDAIIAALPDMVKPLEWEYPVEYGVYCRAQSPIGIYSIMDDEDSAGGAMICDLHMTLEASCTVYSTQICHDYLEPDEVQAAAQADYSHRILSAFDVKDGA